LRNRLLDAVGEWKSQRAQLRKGDATAVQQHVEIKTQLLNRIALQFGDCHFQENLLFRFDVEHVHDFLVVLIVHETTGDVGGTGCIRSIADRTCEDDIVVHGFKLDVRPRQQAMEHLRDSREIALNSHFQSKNLLSVLCKKEDICLTDGDADQIGAPTGMNNGIQLFGIRYQDVSHIARQFYDHGFVQSDRNCPRRRKRDVCGQSQNRLAAAFRPNLCAYERCKRNDDQRTQDRCVCRPSILKWLSHNPASVRSRAHGSVRQLTP